MGRVEKLLFAWLVAMLVGVTATGAYVVVEHVTRCDRFDFSATDWARHAGRNETAHRLVECHRLDGLAADDLRAQLGKPRERVAFKHRPGTSAWTYSAGRGDGFIFPAYDSLWVEVRNGRAIGARIVPESSD